MKKSVKNLVIALALAYIPLTHASESAGIAGMVITNDTIENDNFIYPRNIYTVYKPIGKGTTQSIGRLH